MKKRIRENERDAILQSLRAGVTPKIGLQHIQVGRSQELVAVKNDLDRIASGGSSFRLIIGEYGSGKTFFLNVIRSVALELKLVTIHADLSPDKRIHSTSGHARHLYSELVKNISTRSKPEGNALLSIVEKFINNCIELAKSNGTEPDFELGRQLQDLHELVGGYDFANVISQYWNGLNDGNDNLRNAALRWLKAEYSTKTEARHDLGVRSIIDDAGFYDYLKLLSLFVIKAGFRGLVVCVDEMVNLYKLNSKQARMANYEQILRILNDCLQGSATGIGFILGGTPEFLSNSDKGLYSYEALHSRLSQNRFAEQLGVKDYSATSIHLSNLSPEEMFILLKNIRHVFALGYETRYIVSDSVIVQFLQHCHNKIGAAYFETPRNTIKHFLDFLYVVDQNQELDISALLEGFKIEPESQSNLDFGKEIGENFSDFSF